ncbi:MAG: serpin family protein [Bacteroidales bacterium]|nr:serpin family protein [Bacteroidales bacterium]
MKKSLLLLLVSAISLPACCTTKSLNAGTSSSGQTADLLPDATRSRYVEAGNAMAFRFLREMHTGDNQVISPLSLQFALAMAANGAKGETLGEITAFLGYESEDLDTLNAYCRTLLKQLPAVDPEVSVRLTDALLVNRRFPLLRKFRQTVQENYYAAVNNMDFSLPSMVAARINDWVSRSTDGFIDRVLEASEISDQAVAYIMNALYFKAKWAGSDYNPMFRERATQDEIFYLADGSTRKVQMMRNRRHHLYAEMDGYRVLALPYAGGKFFMYLLLPDQNDLDGLVSKLSAASWEKALSSLSQEAEVNLRLPKFDIENKISLGRPLQSMGVKKAFERKEADFQAMFQPKRQHYDYWISDVIQKSRISVAEWGTEAAAVTVIEMVGATSAGPGHQPRQVNFFADHPFVFLIGEVSTGAILFEGTYTGK